MCLGCHRRTICEHLIHSEWIMLEDDIDTSWCFYHLYMPQKSEVPNIREIQHCKQTPAQSAQPGLGANYEDTRTSQRQALTISRYMAVLGLQLREHFRLERQKATATAVRPSARLPARPSARPPACLSDRVPARLPVCPPAGPSACPPARPPLGPMGPWFHGPVGAHGPMDPWAQGPMIPGGHGSHGSENGAHRINICSFLLRGRHYHSILKPHDDEVVPLIGEISMPLGQFGRSRSEPAVQTAALLGNTRGRTSLPAQPGLSFLC
jgi:hypothetical protein